MAASERTPFALRFDAANAGGEGAGAAAAAGAVGAGACVHPGIAIVRNPVDSATRNVRFISASVDFLGAGTGARREA